MTQGFTATHTARILHARELPALVAVLPPWSRVSSWTLTPRRRSPSLRAFRRRPPVRKCRGFPSRHAAAHADGGSRRPCRCRSGALAAVPDVKPVSAVAIVARCCYAGTAERLCRRCPLGARLQLLLWARRMDSWQMYAWGIVGSIAGFACRGEGRRARAWACTYGASARPCVRCHPERVSMSSASCGRSHGRRPSSPFSPRCRST